MPTGILNFRFSTLIAWLCLSIISIPTCAETPAASASHKFALAVGINQYPNKPLYGCVNDATGIRDLMIESFDFNRSDITLLTDHGATRAAILGALERYADAVGNGDLFIFFFSGHGTLFPDGNSLENDETRIIDMSWLRLQGVDFPDGAYDSAIVPIDSGAGSGDRPWGNLILDDELYRIFSRMTAKGANVVMISDSCHS